MSTWWMELEENASFKHFLGLVNEIKEKRTRALVNARGAQGKPMNVEEYHGTAGEARALEVVLNITKRARNQEPRDE